MLEETQTASVPEGDRSTEAEVPQVNADKSVPGSAEADEAGDEGHDEQAEPEHTGDETPEQKRSGYQRAKVRLEKTRQERDFWRDEALRNRATPSEKDAAAPADELPKLPKLSEYTGTIEEYEREAEAYRDKLLKAVEARTQKREMERQAQTAIESFNERLMAVPEIEEIKTEAGKMSRDLLSYMERIAAPMKNGPEVVKEMLLDPDLREQLLSLDRVKDGHGIAAQLHAVSAGLLIANRKSAAATPDAAATTKAPRPFAPMAKSAGKATVDLNDPNTPTDVWSKEFTDRMERKRKSS